MGYVHQAASAKQLACQTQVVAAVDTSLNRAICSVAGNLVDHLQEHLLLHASQLQYMVRRQWCRSCW